jgi:arylsulfatase A-like enzyme
MDSLFSNKEQKTPKEFYTTDAFAQRACDFIAKNQEKPWFIYLAFNAVHGPYEATQKYLDRFPHVKKPDRRHFCGMLAAMDDGVGLLLAKLRELGLEENTLIFFISDNGSPHNGGNGGLRGTKYRTWEGGIRLPWMMQWKGKLPAGKAYDFPVIQLDVMPTCVRAAGGPVDPAWKLDGVDLMPYLTGATAGRPHETLYWRIDGRWAVRQGDMKLVVGEPDHKPELFDLVTDRNESRDLAAAQPAKVAELTALWQQWNQALPPPPAPTKNGKKGVEE